MAIQCNQYPNPSHNSALPQYLAHHKCEDLDPTETPSAVPTALQAPSDDTYISKCAHNPMESQCNQSQSHTLMKQNCTHNPSTSQVQKSNHTNSMALPYPPDPGEYVLERSAAPTTLVERDKLDLSSIVPPKGEMESSFSWTYLFKSPTSSTLCFGGPTLRKLTQVKLLCNPISSTICDFALGKLNQETELHITKHTSLVNRVSDCHSSLVTTSSSRLILEIPKIEVTKALIHPIGKNGEHFYGITSSRKLTGETNSSSTTLHLDTCSRKLTGETNTTAPHVDDIWLTGMSPYSLNLIGEHITQMSSSFW